MISDVSWVVARRSITVLFATIFALLASYACDANAKDSVPALVQAISELPDGQAVFNLAEGVYTIGSTWRISKPGITVRGAGIGKTVLIRDPQFNGALVTMDAPNSLIGDLTLDGNRTATVISLNQPGTVAEAIEVKNFTHLGVAVPASGCRISKCIIHGYGDPAIQSFGIWRDAGKTSTDSTIRIDHNTITNNGLVGIYCTGGKITIADNQLSGNHSYTKVGGGQIDIGNAFSTNTDALITGNTILNGGGIKTGGMELGGGTFTIKNNTVRGHGSGGIGIGHNVIRATISGNVISNCGRNIAEKNSPQDRSGIYVGYGAANVEISDNRCFDDQPGKTQTFGIILVGPPARPDSRFSPKAVEHLAIKGNDLRGNVHAIGLLDQSHARDRSISGNLPAEANR
jgi:hypothetical protein